MLQIGDRMYNKQSVEYLKTGRAYVLFIFARNTVLALPYGMYNVCMYKMEILGIRPRDDVKSGRPYTDVFTAWLPHMHVVV